MATWLAQAFAQDRLLTLEALQLAISVTCEKTEVRGVLPVDMLQSPISGLITRVILKNFKSIATREVQLIPLTILLELAFAGGATGQHALTSAAKAFGGYEIRREACVAWRANTPVAAFFEVEDSGDLVGWGGISLDANLAPVRVHDRLYLVNASGLSEFRQAYGVLRGWRSTT